MAAVLNFRRFVRICCKSMGNAYEEKNSIMCNIASHYDTFSGRPVSAYTSGFGMGAYKTYTFGSYQIKNSQQGLYSRKRCIRKLEEDCK